MDGEDEMMFPRGEARDDISLLPRKLAIKVSRGIKGSKDDGYRLFLFTLEYIFPSIFHFSSFLSKNFVDRNFNFC